MKRAVVSQFIPKLIVYCYPKKLYFNYFVVKDFVFTTSSVIFFPISYKGGANVCIYKYVNKCNISFDNNFETDLCINIVQNNL